MTRVRAFRLWLFDAVTLLAVLVAALIGLAMPALVLDIVSIWPAYLVAVVSGLVLAWLRHRIRPWLLLLPPISVIALTALVVALHLVAWPQLPSAFGDLAGPDIGSLADVDLAVGTAGGLTVTSGADPLYTITLARRGGTEGVPEALEALTATRAAVRIRETADSFWFKTSGWDLALSVVPAWTLELGSSALNADLRGIDLRSARLEGSGEAALPVSGGTVEVTVSGDFLISVPPGSPVQVLGSAAVPDGWVPTGDGWRSPTAGEGLVIVVESGPVKVVER